MCIRDSPHPYHDNTRTPTRTRTYVYQRLESWNFIKKFWGLIQLQNGKLSFNINLMLYYLNAPVHISLNLYFSGYESTLCKETILKYISKLMFILKHFYVHACCCVHLHVCSSACLFFFFFLNTIDFIDTNLGKGVINLSL